MSTAKQLIPSFVDASPLTWDRAYSKNMRPIRGYPDYWRIIDTEDYVDGPPSEGEQYDGNLYLWRAKILEDESFNLTDTFEIANLKNYITASFEVVNGETIYSYKYNSDVENFEYQHTDTVDSLSLEFDQSGRRIVAFESTGEINLLWFDPVQSAQVVKNYGAGYTPFVVTDTYRREGGSTDSERLLFYVKDSTKQIVYRRQLDRYQVEYTLPDAPADVVEILKVSKNIYGGLTVLYCYEDVSGDLVTGSFTARSGPDEAHLGTDGRIVSYTSGIPFSSNLISFDIKKASFSISSTPDTASYVLTSAEVLEIEIDSSIVNISPENDSADATQISATVKNVDIFSSEINISPENDSADATQISATVNSIDVAETLVEISSDSTNNEQISGIPSSAELTAFSIG